MSIVPRIKLYCVLSVIEQITCNINVAWVEPTRNIHARQLPLKIYVTPLSVRVIASIVPLEQISGKLTRGLNVVWKYGTLVELGSCLSLEPKTKCVNVIVTLIIVLKLDS